jgi:aspartate-semialdehyde dehydrogenase
MKQYTVAVVGATGLVGQAIIDCLIERNFPMGSVRLLASERSAGQSLLVGDDTVVVEVLRPESFAGVDIALFSAGGSVSEVYAPIAAQAGAIVLDNTSFFRMHDTVPLVVPEVNPDAIAQHQGIIANPNCSTAQLVVALKPIHERYTITRLVISTYQSVSGAGKSAIDALEQHTTQLLGGQADAVPRHAIAFNVVPHIDSFLPNGYTKEEMKMVNEIQKILGEPGLPVSVTCARVPVFIGHSEAVTLETAQPIDPADVRTVLANTPGVVLLDEPMKLDYPTPREFAGQDPVGIGRIRQDLSVQNGIVFWCVADNLRKGAALNAVQIAELLVARQLV